MAGGCTPFEGKAHLLASTHSCCRRILQIRGLHHWNRTKPFAEAPAYVPGAVPSCGSASVGWGFRLIVAQWCKKLPIPGGSTKGM
jgi:hypothetical protein